jgi:hypothetical protein
MFSPNGQMLAAAEAGPGGLQLRVWELESGNEVLVRHNLFPLRWAPDSRYLLTFGASYEGGVERRPSYSGSGSQEWENLRVPFPLFVQAWEVLHPAPTYQLERPVHALDFAPDGSRLAVDNTLWEVARTADGARLRRSSVEVTGVRSLALTAVGAWGAVSNLPPSWRYADLVALVQLAPKRRELRPYFPDAGAFFFPEKDRIAVPHLKEIAVSPDGRQALLAWEVGWYEGEDVRRAARLQLGRVLAAAPAPLALAPVLALRPDRLYEAPVNHSDTHGDTFCLEMWNLNEWKRLAVLHRGGTRSFRLTPDGRHLLVSIGFFPADVEVRSAETGDLERALVLPPELTTVPGPLHVSPDGRLVLVRAQVIPTARGPSPPPGSKFSIRVRLSDASTVSVRRLLFEVESGRALQTWTVETGTWTAEALGPGGQNIASGDEDGTLHLWDVATGRERARWRAHEAEVTALAFSPDGQVLVSGSRDGTVKVWPLPYIRKELLGLGLDW